MTVVQTRCFLNEFFSMWSGAQGVLSWFTILQQILENLIRSVDLQHTLEQCIGRVIKQFDDWSLVCSGHIIHISYTFGGRPRVALDLPQYRNQTGLERSIIVELPTVYVTFRC